MRSLILILCLSFALCGVLSSTPVSAQSYAMQSNPSYPQPGESFTLSLQGQPQNIASISWYVNGVEQTQGAQQKEITLTYEALDESLSVVASILHTNGAVSEVRKTIATPRVDMHVYADTYTPAFYAGRALPSSGSTVHATAMVFGATGNTTDTYIYRWRLNGNTLQGGIALSTNTISFTPNFEDELVLQVEVLTRAGVVIAQKTQKVPVVEPEVHFYEKNPLRGLSFTALTDPFTLIAEETIVQGEPYYMDMSTQEDDLHMEWELDGKTVGSAGAPNAISLEKNGATGKAFVTFHVRNLTQLLQGVKESFTVQF